MGVTTKFRIVKIGAPKREFQIFWVCWLDDFMCNGKIQDDTLNSLHSHSWMDKTALNVTHTHATNWNFAYSAYKVFHMLSSFFPFPIYFAWTKVLEHWLAILSFIHTQKKKLFATQSFSKQNITSYNMWLTSSLITVTFYIYSLVMYFYRNVYLSLKSFKMFII